VMRSLRYMLQPQRKLIIMLYTIYSHVSHYSVTSIGKGGGTLCDGSAAALLVFGPVMPKGELALLVLGVCENWHYYFLDPSAALEYRPKIACSQF
jgi:hypothetical protein